MPPEDWENQKLQAKPLNEHSWLPKVERGSLSRDCADPRRASLWHL